MLKIIPLVITTIHDPGGVTRRGAIANFDELISIKSQSPATIYTATEQRYSELVGKLKKLVSKRKLSKDDWATIGELVTRFDEDLRSFAPDFGLEVINLTQALAEDLSRDVNTIQAYLIYSKTRRDKPGLVESNPKEAVVGSLESSIRPMNPREISAASGVNYNTVRRVVQELLRDGKILRARGRGAYIRTEARETESPKT